MRTLTRNAVFLLREAPFAKSRSVTHFDAAIAIGQEAEMFGVVAQAQHGKALALKAMKKPQAARQALEAAEAAIAQVRWRMMADRIESTLKPLHMPG